MSDRIKAILAAGDAAGLPEIARALALDTSLEPEAAQTVFDAAKKDVETASANISQTITTPPAAGHSNSSQTSLGVADRVGGDNNAEAIKAGWAKAMARSNERFS